MRSTQWELLGLGKDSGSDRAAGARFMSMLLTGTARSALLDCSAEQRIYRNWAKRPPNPQQRGVLVDARDVSERYCNY
jgi:hypothetical protein